MKIFKSLWNKFVRNICKIVIVKKKNDQTCIKDYTFVPWLHVHNKHDYSPIIHFDQNDITKIRIIPRPRPIDRQQKRRTVQTRFSIF